jgi:hypothetical protein
VAEVPTEWKKHIIDEDYFLQLWEPKFLEVEKLILFEGHYSPDNLSQWLQIPSAKENLKKLENTINHVHLDDVAEDLRIQREIGESLQVKWHQTLEQTFPDKDFEVNLVQSATGWELQMWTQRK